MIFNWSKPSHFFPPLNPLATLWRGFSFQANATFDELHARIL